MTAKLFETALGIAAPWYVAGVDLDATARTLTIRIDFVAGSRFAAPGIGGVHPVHDMQSKLYRHLKFFQHECFLHVRVPRVKLPDGSVRQVEPDWAGKLSGFTLLFEALVLALCREMTFRAVARLVNVSLHRVMGVCERYVELTVSQQDLSAVKHLAIDESARARGYDYVMLAADTARRGVIAVAEERDAPGRSNAWRSTSRPTGAIRPPLNRSRSTCPRRSSRGWANICRTPASPLISFT